MIGNIDHRTTILEWDLEDWGCINQEVWLAGIDDTFGVESDMSLNFSEERV